MADGDEHFRVGVQHGLDDVPRYRWEDPVHQEHYDAGYAAGQFERLAQVEGLMKRRGLGREKD